MSVLLKLVLPRIEAFVDEAAVVHWHKRAGDDVDYGDPIVDVEVRRIKRMKRDHDAKKILGFRRRSHDRGDPYRRADVELLVRVTSADFGTVISTCARAGEVLAPGDLLAVLATEAGEVVTDRSDAEIAAAAEFRTTTNIVETP